MNTHKLEQLIKQCRDSRLTSWASGSETLNMPPFQIHINPTNICNNSCRMCPHNQVMRKERGHMPMELFQSIVEQLPTEIVRVYLLKQGEPFLNPKLPMMIEFLKRNRPDIHIAVHTNGSVPLKKELTRILENIDSLGISLSAITPKTYKKVHGKNHFQSVLTNLELINKELSKNSKPPHVFIDYVRQSTNASETMEEVINFHQGRFPHLSSIDFHPLFNWQGDINEPLTAPEKIIPEEHYPCCIFPWSTMTICHDGRVAYCQEESKENIFLGDVRIERLIDAWNNKNYRNFRKKMSDREYSTLMDDGFYCKKCSYLLNFHSQSPQNLTQGWMGTGKTEIKLANLLAENAEEVLYYAGICFLSGEIHKARGLLTHLEETDCPQELIFFRDELTRICKKTTKQYHGMYAIKQLLEQTNSKIMPPIYHKFE